MKPAPTLIDKNSVCVLGIPLDENSSFLKGPRLAPELIRKAYFSDSSNLWSEKRVDLGSMDRIFDTGDINFTGAKNPFDLIEESVTELLDKESYVICMGGDHSITFPIIKAQAKKYSRLNILHFDAHPDLYHSLDGNTHSHACPFARIMERKLAARLVQVGIRTMNGHQQEQAIKFDVDVHEMADGFVQTDDLVFDAPVYISLDLDCLDPAFAPGVSHYEPGGMSTREVIDIIHRLKGQVIGGDIVEYNPKQDFNSMTAMVAAKLLKEIITKVVQTNEFSGRVHP